MSTEIIGLLGTGAQDGHFDFHTAPELWWLSYLKPGGKYKGKLAGGGGGGGGEVFWDGQAIKEISTQ